MLNYSALSKNTQHFRNFAGLKIEEFDALNLKIKEKYTFYEQKGSSENTEKEKSAQATPTTSP